MKHLFDRLFRDSAEPNDGTWNLLRTAFSGLYRRPRESRQLKLGGLENRLLYSATPVSPEMLMPDEDTGIDCECALAVDPGHDSSASEADDSRDNGWDMGSSSGDATGSDQPGLLADATSNDLQVDGLDADLSSRSAVPFFIPGETADASDATAAPSRDKTSYELVLVDTSVDDYQQLLNDVSSNHDPERHTDVVLLDGPSDGVEQISRILSRYEDLDAIHVVSHGTEGGVRLGSTWLDAGNVAAYAADVAGWQDALASDADLLFYGCNLAQSDAGRTLVDSLSALTGADVTASSDHTGHALLGGDWKLEYATGVIESGIAFSDEAQQHWRGLLAAPDASDDPGVYDSTLRAINPVGYWRLGESAGTTAGDESATAHDGTYQGPLLAQAGALAGDDDTAASFDGVDDYVQVAHHGSYELDNGTIQLWFNAQNVNAGHLFSKDALGFVNGGHVSAYLNSSGQLEVRLQSATASYFVQSTPVQPITAGQWHHMAFTFGSDGMRLYVDGQLAATNAYSGGLAATSGGPGNTEPIVLGASTQRSGTGSVAPLEDFFHGTIDEVALIGSALTEDQVQDIYAAGIQHYALPANATFSVSAAAGVLSNDFDADGDTLTAHNLDTTATQGLVTLNSDGSFQYDPNSQFDYLQAGQQTTDSFTYRASDGGLDSNVATVTITIEGVNDSPVANDDALTTNKETPLVVSATSLLANDTDADSDTLIITSVSQPTHGSIADNGNATYTYTPATNYEGPDAFAYTASDGNGGSGTANVDITVQESSDVSLNQIPGPQITDEDTTLVFSSANGNSITVSDIDAKGGQMEVTLSAVNGAVSLEDTTGLTFSAGDGTVDTFVTFQGSVTDINSALNGLQFLPAADYSGPATLQITTTDLGNSSAGAPETDVDVIPITINPVNDQPVATGDEFSAEQGTPLLISISSLLANDTDVELDTLSLADFSTPAHGTLVDNGNGTLTYTPHSGFTGTDAFSYTATDGQTASAPATVTIYVEPLKLSGAIPPSTEGREPPGNELPVADTPMEQPGDDRLPAATAPMEKPAAVRSPGVPIVRERFQPAVEFGRELPEPYVVETVSNTIAMTWTTDNVATASVDTVTMPHMAEAPGRPAEQLDSVSIDAHLWWEHLDEFRDQVAWDTGYYPVGAAAATGTFAVLSAGYAAWTVRGGYLLSSIVTVLPAWKLMDPLPVLAAPAGIAAAGVRATRETEETLQTLTSKQPVASASNTIVR